MPTPPTGGLGVLDPPRAGSADRRRRAAHSPPGPAQGSVPRRACHPRGDRGWRDRDRDRRGDRESRDHDPKKTAVAWSAWAPGVSGGQGATAIADHIAPYYRFSASRQLDVVTPMALTTPSSNGTVSGNGLVVAVNTGTAKAEKLSLLGGHTVAYNICGLGTSNCALGGKPSAARLLLLRREALELALYSFKYISGTENVIAVLPPGRTRVDERPVELGSRLQGEPRRHQEQAAQPRRPVRQARTAAVAEYAAEEDARGDSARRRGTAALEHTATRQASWIRSPPAACSPPRSNPRTAAPRFWC